MQLQEFRKITEHLSGNVELRIFLPEQLSEDVIRRDEIEAEVVTLDLDQGVDGVQILSVTDGEPGAYTLR